ncbi:hypothetical protein BH23ACT5_BH23ACT5_08170 [soil metagenome]
MRRPPPSTWVWFGVAATAGALAGWAAVRGMALAMVSAAVALALVASGAGVGVWGKALATGPPDREERHQKGPGSERRRMLMWLGAAGAGVVAIAVGVPAASRVAAATERLRDAGWREGLRLVDAQGRPVIASEVVPGSLFTVFPEGSDDIAQSQVILLGAEPERIRLADGRAGWAPAGMVAYSKLCTHMACPLGLYQEQSGTVVCPCHQAVFDLLGGGGVLSGPAKRPLPQLPIGVGPDDSLVALGGLSDVVGTGYWRVVEGP